MQFTALHGSLTAPCKAGLCWRVKGSNIHCLSVALQCGAQVRGPQAQHRPCPDLVPDGSSGNVKPVLVLTKSEYLTVDWLGQSTSWHSPLGRLRLIVINHVSPGYR